MLHDEDELKQRKNMSFGGCPVRLPHSLSVGPVKLAGPTNRSPGSCETRFLSSEKFKKWDSWDRTGTVRYCTVPYPFHLTSSLQPPNNERCSKPEACCLSSLSRQDFDKEVKVKY
jgi:hypothetical protein